MKNREGYYGAWVIGTLGFLLSLSLPLEALPKVESRTGTPVVRRGSESDHYQDADRADYGYREVTPHREHYDVYEHREPLSSPSTKLSKAETDALEREVIDLRGQVEVQDHEIKQLKKSQQDLYLDLERKISQIHLAPDAPVAVLSKPSNKSKDELKSEATQTTSNKSDKKSDKEKIAVGSKVAVTSSTISSPIKGSLGPSTASKSSVKTPGMAPDDKKKDNRNVVPTPPEKSQNAQPSLSEEDEKIAASLGIDLGASPEMIPLDDAVMTMEQDNASSETLSRINKQEEKLAYDAAYEKLRNKGYGEAIISFQNYLQQFPQGENAPNAYYWLGEVYRLQWQANKADQALLDKASDAFAALTTEFPSHSKVNDAILKLGLIELDRGHLESARAYLTDVKTRFPNTAAGRIAEIKLNNIKLD